MPPLKIFSKIFLLFTLYPLPFTLHPSLSWAQDPAPLANLQETFQSIAQRAGPSCVNISAFHEEDVASPMEFYFTDPEEFFYEFFQGTPREKRRPKTFKRFYAGKGSGIIIDPEGYVLTNTHVVSDAQEIKVRVIQKGMKKVYSGRLIGKDDRLDLALIKIEGQGPFPAAALGNSDEIKVGDWAIAIGSPFELEQTFTVGVISALRQSLPIEGRLYHNMIQTDAAINRGNSGGPLLNIRGEVIGITTAIFSPSGVFAGIGFAIPVNEAKEILADLRRGKEHQWGWLGVSVGEIDEVFQKRFGLPSAQGALINEVFENSPAQKAGLERGDVVVRCDGYVIISPDELTKRIRQLNVDDRAKIQYIRKGKVRETTLTIGARPLWADLSGAQEEEQPSKIEPEPSAPSGKQTALKWEGVEMWDLVKHPKAKALAGRFSVSATEGVIVASIEAASPMAGYLETGDIVAGINQESVKNISEFERRSRQASLKEGIVLDIIRQGNKQFVSIQISPRK